MQSGAPEEATVAFKGNIEEKSDWLLECRAHFLWIEVGGLGLDWGCGWIVTVFWLWRDWVEERYSMLIYVCGSIELLYESQKYEKEQENIRKCVSMWQREWREQVKRDDMFAILETRH